MTNKEIIERVAREEKRCSEERYQADVVLESVVMRFRIQKKLGYCRVLHAAPHIICHVTGEWIDASDFGEILQELTEYGYTVRISTVFEDVDFETFVRS